MSRPRDDEKRERILEAATRVFAEKGYHQTSIADVAALLGMGHGTFYRYYANKLDIFSHVVARVTERIGHALAPEPPDAATTLDEYRAQVQRIGRALIGAFLEHEHAARLLFVEAVGIAPELTRELEAFESRCAELTAAYLRNGVARGFLAADLDVTTTARAIDALLFAAVRAAATAPDRVAEAERWLDAVHRLMFSGVVGAAR